MPRLRRRSAAVRQKQSRDLMSAKRSIAGPISKCTSGTIHQASDVSSIPINNRGKQCTCIAVISGVCTLTKSPAHRTSQDIDSIIIAGDTLYTKHHGCNDYLMARDLPEQVQHGNDLYNILAIDGFCGSIHTLQSDPPSYTLIDALEAAFDVSPKVILQLGGHGQAYASMIEHLGPKKGYFIFDSHARNEEGLPDGNGTAVQLSCGSRSKLSAYIASLAEELAVGDEQFELCPIAIHREESDTTEIRIQSTGGSTTPSAHTSTDEAFVASSAQYMREQERNARVKEQTRICKSKPERKDQAYQKERTARQQSDVKKNRSQREQQQRSQPEVKEKRAQQVAEQRSKPGVKERRARTESEQRSQPDAKKRRASREAEQRSNPKVKKRRAQQVAEQRSKPGVKERRARMESEQRSQPDAKKRRASREAEQRSDPEVKKRRAQQVAEQRSKPGVRERRARMESEQRCQPEAKKRRASREAEQRSDPEVRKRRAQQVAEQRSKPGVRERRARMESEQRCQPEAKKRRASREAEQRSDPEVRKRRAQQVAEQRSKPGIKERRARIEADHRSKPQVKKRRAKQVAQQRSGPEVKERRARMESEQRSQPEVKKNRASREAEQRSNPEVKKRRAQQVAEQRSKPGVKERRARIESEQRSQPGVKKKRASREAQQRSEPEVKKRRAQQVAEQRSKPGVKERRARIESEQRSQPGVKKKRASREAQQRSEPEVKKRRAQQVAEQRSQLEIKKRRASRESHQRSQPDVKKRRIDREKHQRSQPDVKKKRARRQKYQRSQQQKQVGSAVKAFRKKTSMIPDCVCGICNRIRFRHQVKLLTEQHWANHRPVLENCSTGEEAAYICIYCETFVKKNTTPPLSLHGNKLKTAELPEDLKDLNTLERFLITPILPFMKIVTLPSGMQKGIHGPVVCVPSNTADVMTTLPRPVDDTGLIKVKLKRKLTYRGHHLYQQVRTVKVLEALQYLKKNHKDFKDITDLQQIPPPNETDDEEITGMIDDYVQGDHATSTDSTSSSDDDDDDEENETAPPQTTTPLVTCLQPEDLTQYMADNYEDEILCLAPGEGNKPQSVTHKEALAFPTLFPDGKNTFDEPREIRLTFPQYIKSRLLSQDNKCASNPEYIFFLQFLKENEEVMSSARMSLRKAAQPQSGSLSAGEIVQEGNLKNLVQRNHGYKFLAKVRGSAPYWQGAMRDLCAMVRQLGLPTWFCSFSAADRRWPEIIRAILALQGKEVPEEMDWTEHCQAINSNPVIAAIMFDRRVQSLLTNLLLGDAHIIGEVEDYFYRVEFQQRGWPHIHGIYWIKGAPQLSQSGSENDGEVCSFIDRYISTSLPEEGHDPGLHEKVTSVQTHSKRHSRTCRKGNKVCRFNFPKPASTRTFICRPMEPPEGVDIEGWKTANSSKLQVYWDVLNEEQTATKTAADVLTMAGMTQEEFEAALCSVAEKVTVIQKREPSEIWINPYNPTLLDAWNANLDIQYIVDAYSCIAYILSYISKKEAEEGELLKTAQKEAREGNQDAVAELRRIGQTYLTHREVSIMEAVYRALGINLKKSSREVKWIATGDDATRMTLPIRTLQKIAERDSDCTDIFQTSDLERYWCRPRTITFNDMCLADFVANYRVVSATATPEDDSNHEEEDMGSMKLLDGKGSITKRKKSAVLRYMRVPYTKDPEQHYMHQLKLFLPHRNKDIKPSSHMTYEEYVKSGTIDTEGGEEQVQSILKRNAVRYDASANSVEDALDEIHQNGVAEEAWAQVAPNAETLRDDAHQPVSHEEEDGDSPALPDLEAALPGMSTTTATSTREPVPGLTKEDAHKLIRCMNVEQRKLFMTVREWSINTATGVPVQPFYIYLTGGAGTGKSHVVKAVEYEASSLLRSTCQSPDDVTILKVAYTGTAAFNISGQTIHSAFRISVNTSRAHGSYKYQPLGEDLLTTLRAKYRSLQVLIIDEVSMVGRKMMMTISERLKQIRRCQKPFGGVSVLAVGDFYQIAPVGDTAVFKEDLGQITLSPWSAFKVWELHQIMRQKDDQQYALLLNHLRSREKETPLSTEEVDLLLSRHSTEADVPPDTIHIYPRNREVDTFNSMKIASVCTNIHCIKAADVFVSGTTEKLRRTPVRAGRMMLQEEVQVAAGARVMLTTNVDVADGLSNGVLGTVVKVDPGKTQHQQPKTIHVKFDNERVGRNAAQRNPASIPRDVVVIQPVGEDFHHQGSKMKRYQYPLKLAWACTIHKTQGMTLRSAAISLDHIFLPGMAYVALSRISSMDGLYLLDFEEKFIYCEPQVKRVMQDMERYPCHAMPLLDGHKEGRSLVIASLNVHSLQRHILDVRNDPELLTADVLGFSETWLSSQDQSSQLLLEDFHPPIRCDRASGSGRGGVALYVKEGLHFTHLQGNSLGSIECVVADVEGITICLLYRPPSSPVADLNMHMRSLTDKYATGSPCILCGDFNLDVKESPHTVRIKNLQKFQQQITNTTYYDGRGHTSLIDHVYTKNGAVRRVGIISNYYSDHDATYVEFSPTERV